MNPTRSRYKVYTEGRLIAGAAREVLADILGHCEGNLELENLSVDEYIKALIEDAHFHVPEKLLDAICAEYEPGSAELALSCLAASSAAHIWIVSMC